MLANQADSAVEVADDRATQICKFVERCNDLPMWEVGGFIETYLRGDLNLGLLCCGFGDETNYGFIWCAAHVARASNRIEFFHRAMPARDSNLGRLNIDGEQSLVL